MNITLINPLLNYTRGGAEINDLNLGRSLHHLGHNVTYLVSIRGDETDNQLPDWANISQVQIAQFSWNLFSRSNVLGKLYRFYFFYEFANHIITAQPKCLETADLILLTGKPSMARVRKVSDAPVIYSARGRIGNFNEWFARRADGLIFWGGCEGDNPPRFSSRGPFLKVDPGVDETFFYPGTPNPQLERWLRCGDTEALHVVFAGRLDPIKRVEHIIRAVGSAVDQGRSVYLSIVGDGSMRAELEQLAQQHLPGRVTFHGHQAPSALGEIMRASDVFMLTSRTENHPISIKEALACGLDVIAYGVGRVPQLLSRAGNSSVVPVGDESIIATTLCHRVDKGRVPTEQRMASGAVTWRDVAEKIVSWSEKEFKYRGQK